MMPDDDVARARTLAIPAENANGQYHKMQGFNVCRLVSASQFYILCSLFLAIFESVNMQQFIEFVGNHYLLSSAWVALAVLLVYSYVSSRFSPIKELSTHEATMLMNKEDAVVVDMRSANEFRKGHILGARQIGAENLAKGDFSSLENCKDKPIILVCAMGVSAKKPAMDMLKKGFTRVNVLRGGMNAWLSANLPLAK